MELKQKVTLRYPVEFEGRKVKVLELDLSVLKGERLSEMEIRMSKAGQIVASEQFSPTYCAYGAAEAAGVPIELINELMGPDYMEVTALVQGFLNGRELPVEEAAPEKSDDAAQD